MAMSRSEVKSDKSAAALSDTADWLSERCYRFSLRVEATGLSCRCRNRAIG